MFHQGRQEHDFTDVGHSDSHLALHAGGVKAAVLVQAAVDHAQRVANGLSQLFGKRRRHHAGGRAHEEVVAKLAPQLGQRVADCGLGQAHLLGHLRNALLDHELLKEHQLVEIDVRQLHGGSITASDRSHSRDSIGVRA